jgi:hypothetical protein
MENPKLGMAVNSWTFLFKPSGFLLLHPQALRASRIQHALLIALPPKAVISDFVELPHVDATILSLPKQYNLEGRLANDLVERLKKDFFNALVGIRMVTFGDRAGQVPGIRTLSHDGYTALREYGEVMGDTALLTDLRTQLPPSLAVEGGFMAELFIAPEAIPIIPSPFSEIWDDLVGSDPIIPFDRQKRERKLAGAMNKLADRIAAWRRTDLPGWKLDLVAEIASWDRRGRRPP